MMPNQHPGDGGVPWGAFSTATELLRALRQRQVSAVELLELHLRRIERYNAVLNAIVVPNYEAAREAAASADAARMRGEDGPLLGLPLTIKEPLYAEGLSTTAAAKEHADHIAAADSRIVARLRAAGAVILGKTNVPPYSADWQTDNPLYGRTNNPWDLARTPGGSTGGGAAAVAAGLSPLEIGGDAGGSIRIPAAFCGIYGHKPSETALPRSGYFPGPNAPNAAMAIQMQGPLARSAKDLEVAFDVIAGPEVGEDRAWRLEMPPARHERLAEYRVAVLPTIEWLPVEAEILAALDELATRLGRMGARVREIGPQALGDMRVYHRLYLCLLSALGTVGRSKEDCRREAAEIRRHHDAMEDLAWADGLEASAGDYLGWFGQREQYRAVFRAFFEEWDVLLCPANLVNAFRHGESPLQVNGQAVNYDWQFVYAGLASLSGHPATAFPVGQTRSGLPIGLQAMGPYLEDYTSMGFAGLVAQAYGGFRPPPGFDAG
jgi:amidase